MAEKLKSILNRIHWSLLLKAAVFAVAWFLFPFWLFFFIALYLYLVPLFQAGKLAVPFLILLMLTYIQASDPFFMIAFGGLFYLLLLIKDLLLIDRRSAHELLTFGLSFLLLRDFYMAFPQGIGGASLWYAFVLAIGIVLIARNPVASLEAEKNPSQRIAWWLAFLLIWQTAIAGLFLPVDFVYQTILVFLAAVLIITFTLDYIFATLSRGKSLTTVTIIFTLFVLVLTSARWGL